MVLSDAEETIFHYENETFTEKSKKSFDMIFVRGDNLIMLTPSENISIN